MLLPKSRLFNIFLDYVRLLAFIYLLRWLYSSLRLYIRQTTILMRKVAARLSNWICIWISLSSVKVFLCFNVFLEFFLFFHLLRIYLMLQRLESFRNENSSALTACFRLGNEYNGRSIIRLLFCHTPVLYRLFSLEHLFLVIFLNFTIFTRVKPCSREEVVMVRELFLKAFEMDTKGIFASNVVHPKKMVDTLVR